MLSEEEKKAIERLDRIEVYNTGDGEAIDTVLNLITKLQKENEKYKYLYQKALDNTIKSDRENIELKKENEQLKITVNKQSIDISNNLLELQQKDKQIDLMIEEYEYNDRINFKNFCEDELRKDKCIQDCKICAKQYFETKAKKGK